MNIKRPDEKNIVLKILYFIQPFKFLLLFFLRFKLVSVFKLCKMSKRLCVGS